MLWPWLWGFKYISFFVKAFNSVHSALKCETVTTPNWQQVHIFGRGWNLTEILLCSFSQLFHTTQSCFFRKGQFLHLILDSTVPNGGKLNHSNILFVVLIRPFRRIKKNVFDSRGDGCIVTLYMVHIEQLGRQYSLSFSHWNTLLMDILWVNFKLDLTDQLKFRKTR